jgi:cobalt-zinc-cadmium efflux system protein
MPHDHSHGHHHHAPPDIGDRRVAAAIAVNLGLTVVQIAAGVVSGSLAMIADAVHNLSDALSLVIAFFARRIARRPADAGMTFGYGRAEVVAALINYTTLIVIAIYLVAEAVQRLFNPVAVEGWIVVVVAAVALVVDSVTALLIYRMSRDSMNIRAAFLHNVADALGSVAVIIAGTLILLYDWRLIDPMVTLGIAAYILWHAWGGIRPVIRLLMLGSPEQADLPALIDTLSAIRGVAALHHVHLWRMQENQTAFEAHVVLDGLVEPEAVKSEIRDCLAQEFDVSHVVLELESAEAQCNDAAVIGHEADACADGACRIGVEARSKGHIR